MKPAGLATLSVAAVLLAATGDAAFAQADVAQSALPLASSDVSLIALFLQAHWVVKTVMLGCSPARSGSGRSRSTRSSFIHAPAAPWTASSRRSGPASRLRNFIARCRAADAVDGGVLCRGNAEWKRSFESQARSFAGLQMRIEKVMNVSIAREIERLERRLLVLATVGRPAPLSACSHGLGHHVQLPVDRRLQKYLAGGGRPGHRGSAFCHRNRPDRRNSGDNFYNKFTSEVNRQASAWRVCRRVLRDPVAADR